MSSSSPPVPSRTVAWLPAFLRPSIALALASAVSGFLACGPPPPAPVPPDLAAAQDVARFETAFPAPGESLGALRQRLDEASIPGLVVAVIDGGEVLWTRAWGVTEVGTENPVTVDTPFSVDPVRPLLDEILVLRHGADAPRDLDAALSTELFEPLALEATGLGSGPLPESAARGHRATGQALADRPSGAVRLHASASDLAQILTDLQKAHAGKPSRRLDRDQATLLFRQEGLGTGHATHLDRVASADGVTLRATAFVHSGHGAVVLANRAGVEDFTDDVIHALAALYEWPALRDPVVDARMRAQALDVPPPVEIPQVDEPPTDEPPSDSDAEPDRLD